EAAERGAARDEDEPAAPARLELGAPEQFGPPHPRILHDRLVVDDLAENDEAAVMAFGERRQRRLREPRPIRDGRPRLEPQALGTTQDLRNPERRRTELMTNLSWVERNLVEAQQQHKRVDARCVARPPLPTRHRHSPRELTQCAPVALALARGCKNQ